MKLSRRTIVQTAGGLPLAACATPANTGAPAPSPDTLPDTASFEFSGTFLNAAFTHPLPVQARTAAEGFLASRAQEVTRPWPRDNPRDNAVAQFARLINAAPADIAVVPSTMTGENLVCAALGLGPDAGVVTDAFHYHASLALYGEMKSRGMPMGVAAPRAHRIALDDISGLIGPRTKLVAVSMVASETGILHDLAALCDIAHAKGAYVYADIIQAAGAVPIDVKASNVDFCCAATYKWMMGDFGTAFLYVRPDRLPALKRTQVGWRQVRRHASHVFPFDAPGAPAGEWELGTDAASLFEVGTAAYAALAAAAASLSYIERIGIGRIMAHRRPLLERLQEQLPRHGFLPLTPDDGQAPFVSFAYAGAAEKFSAPLARAGLVIQLNAHRVRISPSVYSTMADIDRLIDVLSTHA